MAEGEVPPYFVTSLKLFRLLGYDWGGGGGGQLFPQTAYQVAFINLRLDLFLVVARERGRVSLGILLSQRAGWDMWKAALQCNCTSANGKGSTISLYTCWLSINPLTVFINDDDGIFYILNLYWSVVYFGACFVPFFFLNIELHLVGSKNIANGPKSIVLSIATAQTAL